MMQKIIPAIIPESLEHLDASLRVVESFAREVQIDIVDGQFVPFTSWPCHGGDRVSDLASHIAHFDVELDLMVRNPEQVIAEYCRAGVKCFVVHLESTENLDDVIALKEAYHFMLGFSINNDTPMHKLLGVIGRADYVQLMGIRHIGSQGQPFDIDVLDRVRTLRAQFPDLLISIDGSVNETTLPQLLSVGAQRFVSGSAILKATDPEGAFDALTAVAQ